MKDLYHVVVVDLRHQAIPTEIMSYTIVLDKDLNLSILELAAILDLESKSEDHKYTNTFKSLLDEKNTQELVKQLTEVQQYFATKFARKSFEPTINLYLHIANLLENEKLGLLSSLVKNIDPASVPVTIPSDLIILALTNVFSSLPNTSTVRYDALLAIVNLILKENISGLISNITKNIDEYLSTIENISTEQKTQIISLIFKQYKLEDEEKAVAYIQSLINEKSYKLDSETLISVFATILSSTILYNIASLESSFPATENDTLVKLLKLYLTGDYATFCSNKSEFQNASFASQINFSNLESSFQSLAALNFLVTVENANISYNTISESTKIPVDEIEIKLITLISQGFIAGKLSQSTSSVNVNSVNFSAPVLTSKPELINWASLSGSLTSWRQNVNNLQSVIDNLISKRGKRVNAPNVIMAFHQQKLEAKEAREKKAQESAESATPANA